MYNTENEIYSLASCTASPKYSGDTITLRATPRDGIGPYYVAFKKDGIIIDPSRLGGQLNPITNATEDVEIVRTYTLNDEDVRNALTGTIDFSVFIRGSCPTGGGLQFDGVDDYVDAGNAASLNFGTGNFSLSCWVKMSDELSVPSFIMKTNSTEKGFGLSFRADYNKIFSALFDGTTEKNIYADGTYTINTWYYIVLTVDRTSNGMLYIDGVQQTPLSMSGMTGSLDVSNDLLIGNNYNYARPFAGIIDNVRIYNRALSSTEITNLYNGSTPRDGLVLEHIYSLGNANDLSGYGNNGTLVNGPVFIPNACMDICTIAIGCVAPVCNFVVT